VTTYAITVHTGRGLDGADGRDGLASDVHLTLFGTKASSPEIELGTPGGGPGGGSFGEPTTYRVALADLGDIRRVRVRYDDTGVGPGCFLDRIVVRAGGTTGEWVFPCQRWLARHEDDGRTERTLDAA
jgi:hypothetical protein